MHMLTIENEGKFYPQVYLDECFCTSYVSKRH